MRIALSPSCRPIASESPDILKPPQRHRSPLPGVLHSSSLIHTILSSRSPCMPGNPSQPEHNLMSFHISSLYFYRSFSCAHRSRFKFTTRFLMLIFFFITGFGATPPLRISSPRGEFIGTKQFSPLHSRQTIVALENSRYRM